MIPFSVEVDGKTYTAEYDVFETETIVYLDSGEQLKTRNYGDTSRPFGDAKSLLAAYIKRQNK